MAYGNIFGVTVNEFERHYRNYLDRKSKYEACLAKHAGKGSATQAKKCRQEKSRMDTDWNKALKAAQVLNSKGKLSASGARRMGIERTPDGAGTTPVQTPIQTVDPVTGLPAGNNALVPAPAAPLPVLPLAIGGIAFAAVVGVLLLRRR